MIPASAPMSVLLWSVTSPPVEVDGSCGNRLPNAMDSCAEVIVIWADPVELPTEIPTDPTMYDTGRHFVKSHGEVHAISRTVY